ncbi:unnamed protein product [Citrullus colocynthis]|uniref:Secreted peptide n=1 Tax=Citrullus colocynthis TaxID=252529 RepID=A0ABP0XW03_9ROSI
MRLTIFLCLTCVPFLHCSFCAIERYRKRESKKSSKFPWMLRSPPSSLSNNTSLRKPNSPIPISLLIPIGCSFIFLTFSSRI